MGDSEVPKLPAPFVNEDTGRTLYYNTMTEEMTQMELPRFHGERRSRGARL